MFCTVLCPYQVNSSLPMGKETVKVWDIFVRIFHWSLVVAFVIAYLTAEEENLLHIYSGYAVLGLITFRVFWGIVGTRYARFTNFIYSPFKVIRYLKSTLTGHPEYFLGHNPAGGYMVIALLTSLFVVTISGLKIYAIEEGRGPLAGENTPLVPIENAYADRDEYEDEFEFEKEHEYPEHENYGEDEEEYWEEIHEVSTNITLVLILLHIAGVFISCHVHKENLIKAMVTGKKKVK